MSDASMTLDDLIGQDHYFICLEITDGPDKGKYFPISPSDNNKIMIGSAPNTQICLPNSPDIAAQHALLKLQQNVLSITDQNSSHGTIVNESKIRPKQMVLLEIGDKIKIGNVLMQIVYKNKEKEKEKEKEKNILPKPQSLLPSPEKSAELVESEEKEESLFKRIWNFVRIKNAIAPLENEKKDETETKGKDEEKSEIMEFHLEEPKEPQMEKTSVMIFRAKNAIQQALKKSNEDSNWERKNIYLADKLDNGKRRISCAGFLIRMFAALNDACFAAALVNITSKNSFIQRQLDSVPALIGLNDPLILEGLKFVLFYFLVRTLFVSILGVSLGQWLCGIRPGKTGVNGKLLGLLRTLLEFMLFPVWIICDLPCVLDKRTLKEVLSFSYLTTSEHRIFAVLGATLSLFCMISLALISPMFTRFDLLGGIKVDTIDIPRIKEWLVDGIVIENHSSRHFQVSLAMPKDNSFLFIPTFEISRKNKTIQILPALIVLDTKKQLWGKIKSLKKINTLDWARLAKKNDPLFPFFYENLNNLLNKPATELVPLPAISHKEETLINNIASEELKTLLKDALQLNIGGIKDFIMAKGPFIKGIVDVREKVLDEINLGPSVTTENFSLGDKSFLKFFQDQKRYVPGDMVTSVFISMGSVYSPVMEMSYPYKLGSSPNQYIFLLQLFSKSKWFFDKEMEKNDLHKVWGDKSWFFDVIDVFSKKDLDAGIREKLENKIIVEFRQLIELSLQAANEELQSLLKKVIDQYLDLMKALQIDLPDREKFVQQLAGFKYALEKKNISLLNQSGSQIESQLDGPGSFVRPEGK